MPTLPPAVPRRGNRASRAFWSQALCLTGWKIAGNLPNLPRFVVICAPHTSNWDFCVAMAVVHGLGFNVCWIGKHTLFRWPYGVVMRWLGGIPVVRSERHGLVQQIADAFRTEEQLVIGITPEGTRKRARWKTGFYHIAVEADVPIVPAWVDYRSRTLGFAKPFVPTGDADADIAYLKDFYAPFARAGKRAELYDLREDPHLDVDGGDFLDRADK